MALLKNKEEIINWLESHNVQNYELLEDDKYGYVVNVDGDVDLSYIKLIHIPVKFAHVGGSFYCNYNKLTSLEFCPAHVGGSFLCGNNPLLQETQNINDFKEIYQCHQETKILLAKKNLENIINQKPLSSQEKSKMKV